MAKYDAKCEICGKEQEYIQPISKRDETPICCDEPMKRVILKPPMGYVDTPAAG